MRNQRAFFFSMLFLNFMNFMSTLARLAGILFFFSAWGFTSLLRAEKLRSSLPDAVWSCWYFSKAEKALLANSAMGANVSRFLKDGQWKGLKAILQRFLHLAPDAGAIDRNVSIRGPAFSFRFLLMSRITERVTKMIMTPRANLCRSIQIISRILKQTLRMVDGYGVKRLRVILQQMLHRTFNVM